MKFAFKLECLEPLEDVLPILSTDILICVIFMTKLAVLKLLVDKYWLDIDNILAPIG